MKVMLIVVAVLVGLVVLMAVIGALLPKEHVESVTVRLPAKPAEVFELVDDVAQAPRWRSGLASVEGNRDRFTEVAGRNRLPFRVVERVAPSKRVTRIDDETLPFGGTWTWAFDADGEGTRVTITEAGFVSNVVFRFLSRFVFGHRTNLERVSGDLERAFVRH